MLYRLRSNFRLSIITLFGVCALLGITPFAIYRFGEGNVKAGIADSVILLSICATMAYAWITDNTDRSGLIMAVIACGGGVVVSKILGTVGLLWLYPSFIISFFLAPALFATIVNSVALAVLIGFHIGFESREHMFSFAATSIIVSACAYIFARRNEMQRMRLEHLATLDPLTGIKNRRAMEQELKAAVATFQRSAISYGLAMIDLDYFKRINDEFGHAVGDEVLINCVGILQKHTRQADQLFRFGGEEFVLLLPGVDDAGMLTVIRNLHQALRKELTSPAGPVTASYGLALLRPEESADHWLERADTALYKAKESGRDQVVVAGSEDTTETV